ncbi:hypothetical protein FA95DRAFT_258258 [Auriscalpium vulgare]|uniref:Uncharacterized protein n=1 Tax=Auriscalpium vulgare TaxID=40419 RepID=A0ACB8RJZ5_9AGAM|nr:hypothetical protein FA95DRAFT_258258 [Auriscalpium vulgare]
MISFLTLGTLGSSIIRAKDVQDDNINLRAPVGVLIISLFVGDSLPRPAILDQHYAPSLGSPSPSWELATRSMHHLIPGGSSVLSLVPRARQVFDLQQRGRKHAILQFCWYSRKPAGLSVHHSVCRSTNMINCYPDCLPRIRAERQDRHRRELDRPSRHCLRAAPPCEPDTFSMLSEKNVTGRNSRPR